MRLLYLTTILVLVGFLPIPVQAQNDATFKSVINDLTGLLQALIPILASVALLVFIWGMAEYIFQAGDQNAVDAGRNRMVAGIAGLFVIAAIWGLVQLIGATFSLGIVTT